MCNILSYHSPYHTKWRWKDKQIHRHDKKHVHAEKIHSLKKGFYFNSTNIL